MSNSLHNKVHSMFPREFVEILLSKLILHTFNMTMIPQMRMEWLSLKRINNVSSAYCLHLLT